MQQSSPPEPAEAPSADLDRARAREAAAREILDLISQSRDDAKPVFDAILNRVANLCDASAAALILGQPGDPHQRMAASHGVDAATVARYHRGEVSMDPNASFAAQAIVSGKVVHVDDVLDTPFYRQGLGLYVSVVRDSGIRTEMLVPLLCPSGGIGTFVIFRKEVCAFTPDEIALAETFAAQAVIAIENAQQFRELQTRLEREKASAEILEVISQSREDETPVFYVILRNAVRLCGASGAGLLLGRKEGPHLTLAALHEAADLPQPDHAAIIAQVNSPPMRMDPAAHVSARAICEGAVVQVEDLTQTQSYLSGEPTFRTMVEEQGIRAVLSVPLLGAGGALGAVNLHWPEVRAFAADEIALVETFAAQAVIAIENVRQFRELQTRLEREKASAEILEVISHSRDDDAPVFDVIVRHAAKLCNAPVAWLLLATSTQRTFKLAGYHGLSLRKIELGDVFELDEDPDIMTGVGRAALKAQTNQDEDLAQTRHYLNGIGDMRMLVDDEGIRTRLCVPLISGGRAIGAILLTRREVAPFAPDQIALVETFAAQAVIAIENVRQFRELQTRLAREAATREILEVISQSRDDDAPVFDAVLRNANRLCGTSMAYLVLGRPDDTHMTIAAYVNPYLPAEDSVDQIIAFANQTGMRMDAAEHFSAQAILSGEVVQIADIAASHGYLSGEPTVRILVEDVGVRTVLSVPLFDAQGAIGAISLQRREERLFSDDEITLIQSFAAQAVIAIENVRQFRELQNRLAREAATREILEVISHSRDDDKPVFDVVLRKAAELCNASMADLNIISEDRTHAVLAADWGDIHSDTLPVGTVWPMDSDSGPQICLREGRIRHIHDLADTDAYRSGDRVLVIAVDEIGIRTVLSVPMFNGGRTVACISIYRREVRPFAPDEIALVETFAAQAVIAIENVRQFRELQARLAREAATRDILEVISQSRDDDGPVFETILQSASRLCNAQSAAFLLANEARTHARLMAIHGDTLNVFIGADSALDAGHTPTEAIRTGQCVHIADVRDTDLFRKGDTVRVRLVQETGLRSSLAVPLMRSGQAIGAIVLHRLHEVRPFSTDDIDLLQGFAAQAVIAIENVRQFRELQTRLAREAATREILEVISRNPDDDRPVFDAILGNAIRLCGADTSALFLGRRDDPRMRLAAWRDRAASSSVMEDEMIARVNTTPMLMDPSVHVSAQAIIHERNVHIPDVQQHPSYLSNEPSYRIFGDALGIRSILVVPLIDARGALGVVHVHRREVRPFTPDEIALVETFAAQAVIAIENVRQFKALEALNAELGDRVQDQVGEIERMGRLKRFLPAAVADAVVSSGSERMLSSHRALLGVLFCDIRGFTAFCETAEPEETIEVLQTYHEEMGKLIEGHGAGVDHRMGDGIMVLFNDPLPCDDPAGTAVRLGLAMRDRMAELCRGWKKLGHKLGFGVGVSLGYATVGMVGSGGRIDYTASGTAINLASRLSDEAQDGEILLSPRARLAVEDDFAVEARGEITLKGMREPVEVYRVTGVI